MRIGFIGSGKMATAIMKSILNSNFSKPKDVIASDVIPEMLKNAGLLGVNTTSDNISVVKNSDVIVLAVKPQDIFTVAAEIRDVVSDKLVVSIAAGIKITSLEEVLPNARIIRVMPNLALLVGEGAALVAGGRKATKEDVKTTVAMFATAGKSMELEEKFIDTATALSGSGPAYILYVIENMAEAGRKLGLDKNLAKTLASQACIGAGKLALESGKEPTELISFIASKGGTTEAALSVLSSKEVGSVVQDAVLAAEARAKELGKKKQ